jgi:hypothetical protein
MEAPVNYAKSGDVHIAYRVFGDGPRDMVLIPGTLSQVEVSWEGPAARHLRKRPPSLESLSSTSAARDCPTASTPSKPSKSE